MTENAHEYKFPDGWQMLKFNSADGTTNYALWVNGVKVADFYGQLHTRTFAWDIIATGEAAKHVDAEIRKWLDFQDARRAEWLQQKKRDEDAEKAKAISDANRAVLGG